MSEKLTPLIGQYRRIKNRYPDTLLLFRVGDFYEMFYEDAETGAKALNLVLTSRPHGPHNRVPLAGVPARAVDTYIARLVAQGFKVAVCDQLEAPAKGRPVVRRDVVEVITPGTLIRDSLLAERRNNYLMAVSPSDNGWGLAYADVSTGEFFVSETGPAAFLEEVKRVEPAEILVPQSAGQNIPAPPNCRLTPVDDYYFSPEHSFDKLTSHFGVASLDGYGVAGMTEGICAAGAVLHYLEQTQRAALPHLRRLTPRLAADYLLIDDISRANLELTRRLHADDGNHETGTLFWVLDRTRTPAGSRLMRRWLLSPLRDVARIAARQEAVAELIADSLLRTELHDLLGQVGDLERVASRIALERAGPRELTALGRWLQVAPEVCSLLATVETPLLGQLAARVETFPDVVADISTTLTDDPPATAGEGGVIRAGVNPELDELRTIAADTKQFIASLQEQERQRTGIPNLRVRYNSVFGYYIEVTRSYLGMVPKDYIRKQTVQNAERFVTPELKSCEAKILHAEERIAAIELEVFAGLRRRVAARCDSILGLSAALAELDVLAALALVARERNYVRPLVDESGIIAIAAGRHPVVEAILDQPFITNDTNMDVDADQLLLITGPNMAGKSTYLRQVALIVIMAQTGSFVPAASARIGVVDKVFTRIGASDDLARGVSTFLAEMIETANILNNATSRSLVILDEVGRGTSTNDGLAIAWAAVEYLHGGPEFRPRTLFATHYHELAEIARVLPRVRNYSFAVREDREQVIFLRRLKPGPADKSYGIAVARLAGLPREVIIRAQEVLASFNREDETSVPKPPAGGFDRSHPTEPADLALAADRTPRPGAELTAADNPALARLRSLDIDKLSPLQALNLLAELRRLAGD
uniref:DNA mismatch repair protein MutS n=1 Tax=candidate division WOR-3 bacterium TaxID=2052148 RepID=A0A7C4GGG7_UNCW3